MLYSRSEGTCGDDIVISIVVGVILLLVFLTEYVHTGKLDSTKPSTSLVYRGEHSNTIILFLYYIVYGSVIRQERCAQWLLAWVSCYVAYNSYVGACTLL